MVHVLRLQRNAASRNGKIESPFRKIYVLCQDEAEADRPSIFLQSSRFGTGHDSAQAQGMQRAEDLHQASAPFAGSDTTGREDGNVERDCQVPTMRDQAQPVCLSRYLDYRLRIVCEDFVPLPHGRFGSASITSSDA
jgi:hypothetical protein